MVGPVLGDGVLAVVDKDELRLFVKGAEPGFQPVLVGVTRKPPSCAMRALTCTGSPKSLTSCAPLTSALPKVPGLW